MFCTGRTNFRMFCTGRTFESTTPSLISCYGNKWISGKIYSQSTYPLSLPSDSHSMVLLEDFTLPPSHSSIAPSPLPIRRLSLTSHSLPSCQTFTPLPLLCEMEHLITLT